VKSLLQRINATKILHFKERRVPIGSEEAKRLLSLKVNETGFVEPSPAEFLAKLEECAEGLKSLATWKRVIASTRKPFFPIDGEKAVPETVELMKARSKAAFTRLQDSISATSNELDAICDRVAAELEQRWPSEKLDIIPGSALLDAVYKSYGFRFDKMRDGVAIASQMKTNEVDQELKGLLTRLGSKN
jgi:hypothetical protein